MTVLLTGGLLIVILGIITVIWLITSRRSASAPEPPPGPRLRTPSSWDESW